MTGFTPPARAVAACAIAAAALGVVVAPGLHGNAADAVVERWDRLSTVFAFAMALVSAWSLAASSATLLAHPDKWGRGAFAVLGAGFTALLVVLLSLGLVTVSHDRLAPLLAVAMAIIASGVATSASWDGLQSQETRGVGLVLAMLALAALVRVGAWEVAAVAGERASSQLYAVGRVLATGGVLLEAGAQLVAAVWMGARDRATGIIASNLAAVGALVVTWGAAHGVHAGAPAWQAALHTALADASGPPAPYAIGAASSFLVASSILLAAGALLVRARIEVACALALALLSRGSFDAPLRALAVVVAAHALLVVVVVRPSPSAALRSL